MATEKVYIRKFKDSCIAAKEVNQFYQELGGHDMDVAKCYDLLGGALSGLSMNSDAYLIAIQLAKEAQSDSYDLHCKLWIDCRFAQIKAGDKELPYISLGQATNMCRLLAQKVDELLDMDEWNIPKIESERKKIIEHMSRIYELFRLIDIPNHNQEV